MCETRQGQYVGPSLGLNGSDEAAGMVRTWQDAQWQRWRVLRRGGLDGRFARKGHGLRRIRGQRPAANRSAAALIGCGPEAPGRLAQGVGGLRPPAALSSLSLSPNLASLAEGLSWLFLGHARSAHDGQPRGRRPVAWYRPEMLPSFRHLVSPECSSQDWMPARL